MSRIQILLGMLLLSGFSYAQTWEDAEPSKLDLTHHITYQAEFQTSVSKGKTPLWLNANKYGLSSLEKNNGYVRGCVVRPLETDSLRKWGVGYGLDVAVPYHYTSHFVVQQAFFEGRWLHGVLTVGSKEFPMELKNNALSSGSQTHGINARPVPQVRLALPDYWTLPIGNGWLHIKGHLAYGMMTDDNWQHEFTQRKKNYADHVRYHSKAGYLKIGNAERFCPWSLELGLEMACTFGGTPYSLQENGEMKAVPTSSGLKDYWYAFVPGGSDSGEGVYGNVEGNHVGSWVFRINYDADTWNFALYGDHYFEDHSQMFLLDYNGYGSGDEWNVKKNKKFFVYDLKDIMLGAELNLKYNHWLNNIVLEYLYTKYQSGPYNHDRTMNISDHVAGLDDYYNHAIYTGWQHWGQVMGNPLYLSPMYNHDGSIVVKNNRLMAFHLGISGQPSERVGYRVLATWQEGLGTYGSPYTRKHHAVNCMAEGTVHLKHNWDVRGAYAMDFGHIFGSNAGFQLTVSKKGVFN